MVARVKTWASGNTLTAADLNTEFDNLVSAIGTATADHIDLTDVYAWTGVHTFGANDTGVDVKMFGATDGAFLKWDESADELELRGGAATPGKLLLATAETTVVDGNKLGQIDFQAPLDSGLDSDLVGASIWAEADDTFSDTINDTDLVFAVAESETALERARLSYDGTAASWAIVGATTMTLSDGSIIDSSGAISFGNENLTTTGTLSAGATTATSLILADSQALTMGTGSDATIQFDATNTVLATAGAAIFQTNGTTEAMRIDSGQHVLIGNDASSGPIAMSAGNQPNTQLLGSGAVNDGSLALSVASTGTEVPIITMTKSRNAGHGGNTIVQDNDVVGLIYFGADDGTNLQSRVAAISVEIDGTPGANDTPGRIEFHTTPDGAEAEVERWRITSDGVFTSAAETPANAATADGSVLATGGIAFTDVANAWIDDATHGSGTVTHYIGNETIDTTASDERLKENITEPQDARRHLQLLSGSLAEYDYKNGTGHFVGLPAQNVRRVLPQYVIGDDAQYSVRYQYAVGPLLWGWQDHEREIAELKNELKQLKKGGLNGS